MPPPLSEATDAETRASRAEPWRLVGSVLDQPEEIPLGIENA